MWYAAFRIEVSSCRLETKQDRWRNLDVTGMPLQTGVSRRIKEERQVRMVSLPPLLPHLRAHRHGEISCRKGSEARTAMAFVTVRDRRWTSKDAAQHPLLPRAVLMSLAESSSSSRAGLVAVVSL